MLSHPPPPISPSINKYRESLTFLSHHHHQELLRSPELYTKRFDKMMPEKRDKGAAAAAGEEEETAGSTCMRTAETFLRLVPMGLCIVSLVVMLKNSQTNDFGSLSYSNLGAFRYMVHANGVCAGYSLLSAVVVAVPRPSTMSRAWTFFLLDQILTYVILAAGAVSAEVVYLAYKGDQAVTWSEACTSFSVFCHKDTASVVLTFVVMLFYAVISLISSYRLFSKYDAPITQTSKGIELGGY